MPFDVLLQKIAANRPLSSGEFSELQNITRELDDVRAIVKKWERSFDTKIDASNLSLPFVPIYSQVLEADSSSIAVEIPGDYKHLMIMGQGRTDVAGTGNRTLYTQVNGDSGNNYSAQTVTGENLTATAVPFSTFGLHMGVLNNAGHTAGKAGGFFCVIPHYTSSFFKNSLSLNHYSNGANYGSQMLISSWANTTAIYKLAFTLSGGGNIVAGSLVSIYGIK